MKKLERKIIGDAINVALRMNPKPLKGEYLGTKQIIIPFICEGVIDSLVYDTMKERITAIEYKVGVGKGVSFVGSKSGYFEKTKTKTIKL